MAKAKSASAKVKETPLMKQYNAIKTKHPGALLLFRVGDFYETFGEDAVIASKVLEIVLTKRANGSASHIELAGFPHHALDNYLPKLVKAGKRVAICDQLEDPKSVKGIVKRGVTELVTPGLSFNDNVLEQRHNNYLASIYFDKKEVGAAFLDLSTGEFMAAKGALSYIEKLFQGFRPAEVIFSKAHRSAYEITFSDDYTTYALDEWVYGHDFTYEKLTGHFGTKNLKGFGIEALPEAVMAAGAVLHYLEETEHREVGHIAAISRIAEEKYVWLDKFTIRNLELVYPQQEGGVPLIEVLDSTVTPMGSRLMKKWLVLPLKDVKEIQERHNVVSAFVDNAALYNGIMEYIQHIGDLERLISKVAVGRANPREMLQLKRAIKNTLPINTALEHSTIATLENIATKIDPCVALLDRITTSLKEEVPLVTNQGGLMKEGLDPELDELRSIAFSGKDHLLQIQKREVEATGIPSLKIAYNKVFGYYLEVSNAHKDKVPETWIRKQTLVNAERYITEELKVYEEKILNAEDRLVVIEQQMYMELVQYAADFVPQIQQNARYLAIIDCLLAFAHTANTHNYARPEINEGTAIDIKAGRHPVIEKKFPTGESYIPNDVYLDNTAQQVMVITGPNMAGKSALLRQTALIVLMAQMGAFVPAEAASMGIIDKVFTRVGAADNLAKGESTFMVEMTETASILNNLSDRSLVLMDEIGRGTSTYDGVSIAWSILEYLHNHNTYRAKTLFATHYHELNQLSNDLPRIKNFNVAVKEVGDKVIFMRKLKEGGSEHSFGIHVAQMAGMPNPVLLRANEILHFLEKDKRKNETAEKLEEVPKANFQLNLFEADPRFQQVSKMMDELDINTIAPVEALLKLNEIKTLLSEKK